MIAWNRNFETGYPDIDRDHQKICAGLNQIEIALNNGAGREQIAEMIAILQTYTLVHFRSEERIMACVKCPRHGENCEAHHQFEARLEHWLEVLTLPIPGVGTTILRDVHDECSRWVQEHILQIDSALRSA